VVKQIRDRWSTLVPVLLVMVPRLLGAQEITPGPADSVSFRFIDADMRAVASSLAPYLSKPLLQSGVPGNRVSLEATQPVPRGTVVAMLRGLAESNGLELVEDSLTFRLRPRTAEPSPEGHRVQGAGGPVALHVIRLRHARATEIANSINQLFNRGGGEFAGRGGIGRSSLSEQLRASAGSQGAAAPQAVAGGAALTGEVTIVPDEVTNSLLIRASGIDFALITSAVEQLDIRPLQVLVEVMIVEARKDRGFSLGADVTVPQQSIGDGTAGGQTRGGGLGDLVVRLMDLGRGDVDAVIRTAQNRGDVEILSRPVLIASNNTEATFMVGSQRPFASLTRSHATDDGVLDKVVTYRDVGTRLTILPTINQDGYVALEILQEINQATSEGSEDAPVISTREAHTQVLVRDGQTIMLGGLRDRQRDRTRSGVPILSQLPLIGGFFGGERRQSSETELFLFLTPRILKSDADVDRATADRMPDRAREAP
jgi:type II secretory pathway component GspD/PulD (secretin)